jgi:hypothetical protein
VITRVDGAILRHGAITRQRRAAEPGQIQLEFEVPPDVEIGGHGASRPQLVRVPLTVVDAERRQRESVAPGHRRRRVGIESTAEQHDGTRHQTPRASGDQMYLCA